MKTTILNLLKSTFITLLLIAVLYAASAFLIMKNEWGLNTYFYVSLIIHILITAILTCLHKNEQKVFLNMVPLLLFMSAAPIIFRHFHYHYMISLAAVVITHFLIILIIRAKKHSNKRNIQHIRRNYEKLRKR